MNKKNYRDILDSAAADSLSRNSDLWPKLSAQLERNSPMLTPRTRPVMAILLAIFTLLALSGAAYALGRTLGYLPGYGLVDSTSGLRILAEPVSVTRDGVTLTISSVFVYPDRVEMIYDVQGIDPVNDGYSEQNINADGKAFCGPQSSSDGTGLSDGDAALRLPDGTIIKRMFGNEYQQNVFAMKPVYKTSIPADVNEMTMLLTCIPNSRLGAVPENWEVPFQLKAIPAETVVGAPVIEVAQPTPMPTLDTSIVENTEETVLPAPVVTVTLRKVVPMESATVFYISIDMENKDPSLISIMPLNVYALDSTGEKVWLIGNYMWQPFEHPVGSEFQFTTYTKPAAGPVTIVVENAVAVYAPLYTDPPQAKPEEMTFSFDAGENPQYGQTWDVNNEFTIAGYHIKVTSIRAASFKDIDALNFPDGSQGFEYGYDFMVEGDPSIKMQPLMDILSDSPVCYLSNGDMTQPTSTPLHFIQLCRDTYPKGTVKVNIWQLSVLVEDTWQVTWQP